MKVEIERNFKASKEQLYKFWTDPNLISHWMGVSVKIDSKVGGKLDIGFKDSTHGIFKELKPFDKVVFTWNSLTCKSGEPTGETLVAVTFETVSNTHTKMRLVHTGFQTETARKDHEEGWTDYYNTWEQIVV